jgi:hypothetical protein
MMPSSSSERNPSCLIPIVVALIGALGAVAAALISSGAVSGFFVPPSPTPAEPKASGLPISTDASKGFRVEGVAKMKGKQNREHAQDTWERHACEVGDGRFLPEHG